jgi:hypothetical protein
MSPFGPFTALRGDIVFDVSAVLVCWPACFAVAGAVDWPSSYKEAALLA